MIKRQITGYTGKEIIACDGNCEKAWGINNRPKVQLDPEDEDDYYFIPDQELDFAPIDPGTSEGGHKKPAFLCDRLDDSCIKWCYRECERSRTFKEFEIIVLPDFSKRVYNIPSLYVL